MRPITATLLSLLVGLAASGPALGQGYPNKPLRLIVPFPPGGSTDVLSRVLSQKASEKLGQTIVIENRPGAGGTIGSDFVAKSAPDGYTLLMATGSTHAIAPAMSSKLPYSVERDFTPIGMVANSASVLVVPSTLPVKTLDEFIKLARSKPGQFNFGSSGNGTTSHLSGELFKAQAGLFITHIPYRGTGLVLTDMLSGQVQMLVDSYVTSQPHIRDGKLRALGVTSLQRLPFLPDVPTIAEQGLKGFEISNWYGLYAPKGTPQDLVLKVNAAFNQTLQDPDVIKRLLNLGATPLTGTPEDMAKSVAAETLRWRGLIRDRKITVD